MKSTMLKIATLYFSLLIIIVLSAACSKKTDQAVTDIDITQSNATTVTPMTPELTPTESVVAPTVAILSPTTVPSIAATPTDKPTVAPNPTDKPSTEITPTDKPVITSAPTDKPTATIAPTLLPTPLPSDDTSTDHSEAKIIAIDAGHQSKGNYDEEPIGPGSDITKPKVSSGTQGAYTGVAEYELNLSVAKKVKEELIARGYDIVMIRDTNNVNLSNKERAEIANDSGANLFIRIHADGSDNHEVNGVSTLYPSKKNPYVPWLSGDSYNLAKKIVDAICDSTGAKNRGAIAHDDMSGINWCSIPVTIIEMGYMTNKTEDELIQTEEYQDKIVQGICDGIDQYFE